MNNAVAHSATATTKGNNLLRMSIDMLEIEKEKAGAEDDHLYLDPDDNGNLSPSTDASGIEINNFINKMSA